MNLEKVESVVRPLVESHGFFLYDVEMVGRTLRVCIEKPQGVNLQDCVEVTKMLNPVLDLEDIVPGGSYELEVSSPGLDRRLRKSEHFAKAIGEKILVTTLEALASWNVDEDSTYFENRRNVGGVLTEFDGQNLRMISNEGRKVQIPLGAILKASVDFSVMTTPKKGKKV